jgi:hypothetical protein
MKSPYVTTAPVIRSSQMSDTPPHERVMRWTTDSGIITYNRSRHVLTVDDFRGYDDDGNEISRRLDPAAALAAVTREEPGWPAIDGFVLLLLYYGDRWTIHGPD